MPIMSYATNKDESYVDWKYVDGTGREFNSYFLSGFKVHGNAQQKFQGNYLVLYSRVVENSSALISYRWDYSDKPSTHRFSQEEQVYLHRDDHKFSARRLWLRGQGLAMQIHVRSDGTRPFQIIGYSMFETGNATP
jgi:hypothetical protein